MGTRSYIGVTCDDGIRAIYNHWDGYPEHTGKILQDHYTDFLKVCTLVNHGDLSSIGPEIGEKHNFDERVENSCTFYGRDRGETDCGYDTMKTEDDFLNKADAVGAEYAYLFSNGQWTTFRV